MKVTRSSRVSRSRLMREQLLLNHVLQAARCEHGVRPILLLLRQLPFAQPRHRPIEVMQIEPVDGRRWHTPPASDRAARSEPLTNSRCSTLGEEHRPLQCKAALCACPQAPQSPPAAGLIPQPLEHQRRPDPTHCDLGWRHYCWPRSERMAFAAKRAPERTSCSSWPLACNSSKRASAGDHLLAHLIAVAAALD